jgi:hypothetical protein
VTIPLVDLKAQYATIRGEIGAAMQRVLDETCFILGPPLESFERDFASFCGAKHCIGVASGTDAIHLIFRALGIGPGDDVLVPGMTFIASAIGVSLAGATPVLVDVKRDDALLDPGRVRAAVSGRTKAILAVHLYGRCADMDALAAIAREKGLLLVAWLDVQGEAGGLARLRGRRVELLPRQEPRSLRGRRCHHDERRRARRPAAPAQELGLEKEVPPRGTRPQQPAGHAAGRDP